MRVYARPNALKDIQGVQAVEVPCGLGNVLANKGATCVLLRLRGASLALINAHLAAHQDKVSSDG